MSPVSDIKLIRTDTTLDLSQKAEKGMPSITIAQLFMHLLVPCHALPCCYCSRSRGINHARSCAAGCQLLRCAVIAVIEVAFAYRLWEAAQREKGLPRLNQSICNILSLAKSPFVPLRHQLLLSVAMTIALPTYKYPRMANLF